MPQVRSGHDTGIGAISRLRSSKIKKMGKTGIGTWQENEHKTVQERIAEEDLVQERHDEKGNRWQKIYFGGGEHYPHWLEQFKELGEVQVEEVDSRGFKCFEDSGEKLFRVWLKKDKGGLDDLF
jgi:hypothetical protein